MPLMILRRDLPGFKWTLNSETVVLYEKEEGDLRHWGEAHMKTEAEIRVICLQAKELGRHGTDSSPELSEGTNPANILV